MAKPPSLSHILSYIFPIVSTLPLSLHTLNTTAFAPESKNEDLHSGWLQLPFGSVCVVSEGGVTEGGVFERGLYLDSPLTQNSSDRSQGLTNLRALQEMMSSQTLEYVFPYSHFTFDAEAGFLVLSQGRKSAFFQVQSQTLSDEDQG